jgi:DNA-binding transcriptional LysR family regulator
MQPLDTTKLQTFVTIVQEGSFTRAAERLNLTQPTVSQQMALLERRIGAPLFIRQPRQLTLTEAGCALLDHAERILALSEEAIQSAQEAAGLAQRTLRLGVGHTLAIYLLPDLLRQLHQGQSDIQIRLQVGNTADLLLAVADRQVDLALVGSPAKHPQLRITPFMEDKLVVILNPDDPWRDRTGLTLADLKERTLITRESGSALHASVRELLGADHLSSSKVIILGETEAIKRSVEAGLGIALVQGIAVQREVKQGILHTIPLLDAPAERRYNVAQRLDDPPSPVMQLLLDLLFEKDPTEKT